MHTPLAPSPRSQTRLTGTGIRFESRGGGGGNGTSPTSPSPRGLLWSQLQAGGSLSGTQLATPSPSFSPGGGLFGSLLASVQANSAPWGGPQLSSSVPATAFFAGRQQQQQQQRRAHGAAAADDDSVGVGIGGEQRVRGGRGALLALGTVECCASTPSPGLSGYSSSVGALRSGAASVGACAYGSVGAGGRGSTGCGLPPISRPPRGSSSSGGSGGGWSSPGRGRAGLRQSKSCISFSQSASISPSPSERVNVFATAFAAASSLESRHQRQAQLRHQAERERLEPAAAGSLRRGSGLLHCGAPGGRAGGEVDAGSGAARAGGRQQAQLEGGRGAGRQHGLRPIRSAPPGSWGLLTSTLMEDFDVIPEEPLMLPPAAVPLGGSASASGASVPRDIPMAAARCEEVQGDEDLEGTFRGGSLRSNGSFRAVSHLAASPRQGGWQEEEAFLSLGRNGSGGVSAMPHSVSGAAACAAAAAAAGPGSIGSPAARQRIEGAVDGGCVAASSGRAAGAGSGMQEHGSGEWDLDFDLDDVSLLGETPSYESGAALLRALAHNHHAASSPPRQSHSY